MLRLSPLLPQSVILRERRDRAISNLTAESIAAMAEAEKIKIVPQPLWHRSKYKSDEERRAAYLKKRKEYYRRARLGLGKRRRD